MQRVTIIVSVAPGHPVYVAPTPGSADLSINIERTFSGASAQEDAEHYAAGVAAGLRACGRSCEVVIDVPEEATSDDGTGYETDDDMLDMGALDQWAQQHEGRAAVDPEADPVERRLAREAEAGRFIAEARGL